MTFIYLHPAVKCLSLTYLRCVPPINLYHFILQI